MHNARVNGLTNITTLKADIYNLNSLTLFTKPEQYTKILLDPPRSGAEILCIHISKFQNVERIVYVSCNPETGIRHIDILCDNGYKLESFGLVDLFPQTPNIECIALLTRKRNAI